MVTGTLDWDNFDAVCVLLENHPAVDAVDAIGLAVAGRLRADSDADIAIMPRPTTPLSVMDRVELSVQLGRILGRPIDLGVFTHANLVYAKEAVAHGRLICERDHGTVARFAMLTLSMDAASQEARREVLRSHAA